MYQLSLEYLVSIKVTTKTYKYLPYNSKNSLYSFRVNDFVTTSSFVRFILAIISIRIYHLYFPLILKYDVLNAHFSTMTKTNNNSINQNRETLCISFKKCIYQSVSRQLVSIFSAVKIIIQIRTVQEYMSSTCPFQALIVTKR